MSVYLVFPGGGCRVELRKLPKPGSPTAEFPVPCPRCSAKKLVVAGRSPRPSADDRAYEAEAFAECCGAAVGLLRAEVETFFGVREDEAMLGPDGGKRWRVYG